MRPLGVVPCTTIVSLVLLTACSSSHHASQDTTTSSSSSPVATANVPTSTTAGSPGVRVVVLTGPPMPVQCNAPSQIDLHWETRHATSVTLRINGGDVFARYADGRRDELVPLTCDGNRQTYQLTAHASNGETATKTLTVTERAST